MKMTVIINESEGLGCMPSVPCWSPQWEQNFRLLGSLFLAVAEIQNRLVEFIVEGKMKPASFLPSDGRADGEGRWNSLSSNSTSEALTSSSFSGSRYDASYLQCKVFKNAHKNIWYQSRSVRFIKHQAWSFNSGRNKEFPSTVLEVSR